MMADEIEVRSVNVEFLRPGPPHNQLLSPLTQYLAICGDSGAGVVKVPYEHAVFERKLKELRYETGDAGDRLAMLHEVGADMGRILGAVPGLPGALTTDPSRQGTLIHLRLTLSASELAHLPFELAKLPIGPEATAESWLAIQTRPPVCLTRNIRTVSPEGVVWPEKPRILFVSGDPDDVPFVEHRDALLAAIGDFRYPGADDEAVSDGGARVQVGSLLTVLCNPTLAEVLAECRKAAYTHVHLLTHGDQYESSVDSFGLVLRGPDDGPDVVSGERFASALTSVGDARIHRPSVVTIASCDSANVGTVAIPGASFAHALHQSGIPLVVASQFPLSKEGSVPLAGALYQGLLWGEHPLVLLQRLRAELHARYTSVWHDWASLVVYEALPQALADQLDTLKYLQARRAIDAGLQRFDLAVRGRDGDSLAGLDEAIERAVGRLPLGGSYGVECIGLRASSMKRRAQCAFTVASRQGRDVPVAARPARPPRAGRARLRQRRARPARQRGQGGPAGCHAALGARPGRVPRRGAGQGCTTTSDGSSPGSAPTCTAGTGIRSKSPGPMAAWPSCGCFGTAGRTPRPRIARASPKRRSCTSTNWSAPALRAPRSRCSRRWPSSGATSTGGAVRASSATWRSATPIAACPGTTAAWSRPRGA